jgi:hypothetical protein
VKLGAQLLTNGDALLVQGVDRVGYITEPLVLVVDRRGCRLSGARSSAIECTVDCAAFHCAYRLAQPTGRMTSGPILASLLLSIFTLPNLAETSFNRQVSHRGQCRYTLSDMKSSCQITLSLDRS